MAKQLSDRYSSLFPKLCKALYNETTSTAMEQLEKCMASFARKMQPSESKRTHTTVHTWFKQIPPSFPDEVKNFRFIKEFTIDVSRRLDNFPESANNPKKILNAVIANCSNKVREFENEVTPKTPINFSTSRNMLNIRQSDIIHFDDDAMQNNALGWYETVRQPLMVNDKIILTREYIHVLKRGSSICIDWFFKTEGKGDVHRFSGNYILTGDAVWFFLFNTKFRGRFRVLSSADYFWKNKTENFGRSLLLAQAPFFKQTLSASRKVLIRRIHDSSFSDVEMKSQIKRIQMNDIIDRNYQKELEEFLLSDAPFGIDIGSGETHAE